MCGSDLRRMVVGVIQKIMDRPFGSLMVLSKMKKGQ